MGGRVNGYDGREASEKKSQKPTRRPDVWATQIRVRIYRPGHPSVRATRRSFTYTCFGG